MNIEYQTPIQTLIQLELQSGIPLAILILPSAPFSYQACMVKVWCKFNQNWTKTTKIIQQKP